MQFGLILIFLALAVTSGSAQTNLYSLGDSLIALEAQKSSLDASASSSVKSAQTAVSDAQSTTNAAIASATNNQFNGVNSRLAALEALAADFSRISKTDITNFAAKIKATVSSRIAAEAVNRASVTASLNAIVSTITANAGTSLNTAQSVRTAQLSTMQSSRTAASSTNTANLNSAISTENSRQVQEASDFNAQVSTTSSSAVVSFASTMTAETSRADARCDSALAAIKITNSTGTTNDFQTCSTTGTVYYSQGNAGIYACDGTIFGTFATGGFSDSVVLSTRAQTLALIGSFGTRWVLCYRASIHGYSGQIFHSNCNGRGSTVLIAKTSLNRIFGAYIDRPWMSTNLQTWSSRSLLYRFDPTNTNNINFANIVSYGNQNYAMYDYKAYGPCYGSTADVYIYNSGAGVSFSPSYYSAINSAGIRSVTTTATTTNSCGVTSTSTTTSIVSVASSWTTSYDNTALGGSSSATLSDWEVYYMI